MTTLEDIGNEIRDAYAVSMSAGHACWMRYVGEGMRVFHVPELPGDGTPVDVSRIGQQADAEVVGLAKLDTRITVQAVRQVGDDLLILETEFTGTIPGGKAFSYPNVLLYSFADGKIVRLVEVGSRDMWSSLRAALAEVGYSRGAGPS
jgi:ketosteroid isomerase-like protein